VNVLRIDFDALQAGGNEEGFHGTVGFSQRLPEISELNITFGTGWGGIHNHGEEVYAFSEGAAAQEQASQAKCRR
jgi:hypothetical protein